MSLEKPNKKNTWTTRKKLKLKIENDSQARLFARVIQGFASQEPKKKKKNNHFVTQLQHQKQQIKSH